MIRRNMFFKREYLNKQISPLKKIKKKKYRRFFRKMVNHSDKIVFFPSAEFLNIIRFPNKEYTKRIKTTSFRNVAFFPRETRRYINIKLFSPIVKKKYFKVLKTHLEKHLTVNESLLQKETRYKKVRDIQNLKKLLSTRFGG